MCSAGYQTLLEQSPDHQILFYMQRLQVLQMSCAFVIYSMLTNLHIRQCKTMYGMVKWNDHGIRCNVGHLLCGFYWGVLLPRLTFESIFLCQVCIFFYKKSLANGTFFFWIPYERVHFWRKSLKMAFGGWIIVRFRKIFLTKVIYGLKFLKVTSKWGYDQEMALSQGNVFDQIFLSRGYPISKTGAAHPRKKVFETCHIYHRNIFVNDRCSHKIRRYTAR